MKSLSKVIKSTHVANLEAIALHLMGRWNLDEAGDKQEGVHSSRVLEEMEQLRENILRETETMVSDLINQAREQAAAIIAEAHDQAEELLAKARQEGEALRQQAMEQGKEEGWQHAQAQWAEKIAALTTVIETATTEKKRAIIAAEELMLELVLAISARILKRLPELDPEYLRGQLEAVVEKVMDSEQGILYVNPQSAMAVNGWLDEIIASHPTLRKLKVQPDSSLSPGSVILETQYGRVEAIVEEQLQNLGASLKGVIEDELDSEEMALSGVN